MNNIITAAMCVLLFWCWVNTVVIHAQGITIHDQIVKESLDIQESRDRENKLAEYVKTLDYEISVLATKDK